MGWYRLQIKVQSELKSWIWRILTGLLSFLPLWEEATCARYWMTFFVFSVLPAPDSPLWDKRRQHKQKTGILRITRHETFYNKPKPCKNLCGSSLDLEHTWGFTISAYSHTPSMRKILFCFQTEEVWCGWEWGLRKWCVSAVSVIAAVHGGLSWRDCVNVSGVGIGLSGVTFFSSPTSEVI